MKTWKIWLWGIIILIAMLGLGFATGELNVLYTKTVGKAQQNANREVYEETNSFTRAKRAEAIKLYRQYNEAKTEKEKAAIATIARMSFADFNEDKYITDYTLRKWIKKVKYGR